MRKIRWEIKEEKTTTTRTEYILLKTVDRKQTCRKITCNTRQKMHARNDKRPQDRQPQQWRTIKKGVNEEKRKNEHTQSHKQLYGPNEANRSKRETEGDGGRSRSLNETWERQREKKEKRKKWKGSANFSERFEENTKARRQKRETMVKWRGKICGKQRMSNGRWQRRNMETMKTIKKVNDLKRGRGIKRTV